MKASVEDWVVFTLVERSRRIDPRPPYQRGPVWNLRKQQLLIDSILREYDFPKIYLREMPAGSEYGHEVVDGQQRLLAIWAFVDNEFPLGRVSEDIPDLGNLRGKKYSELTQEAKDRLGFFKVSVTVIRFLPGYDEAVAEQEIRDLFLRLQEGESLNAAEKRNAVSGPVRDFVISLVESHRLFPALGIADRRFSWQELGAVALTLEIAGGPTDLKATDLMRLYRMSDFDSSGAAAGQCEKVLDYMAGVASLSPGALRTRWGYVDLYLAIRVLLLETPSILEGREQDVLNSHLRLEAERVQAAGALDELLMVDDDDEEVDPEKLDLFTYTNAFAREGGTKRNIDARHQVYLKRLRADLELPPWSERAAKNG